MWGITYTGRQREKYSKQIQTDVGCHSAIKRIEYHDELHQNSLATDDHSDFFGSTRIQ